MTAVTEAQKTTVKANIVAACRHAAYNMTTPGCPDPRVAVTITRAGVASTAHTDVAVDGIRDWYTALDAGTTGPDDVVGIWTFGHEGGNDYDDVIDETDIADAASGLFNAWLTPEEDGPSPDADQDPEVRRRRMASPASQALGSIAIDANAEWTALAAALKASYADQIAEDSTRRPIARLTCSYTNYDDELGTVCHAELATYFGEGHALIDLGGAKIPDGQIWDVIDIANTQLAPFGISLDGHGCGGETHEDPDPDVDVDHDMLLPFITLTAVTE